MGRRSDSNPKNGGKQVKEWTQDKIYGRKGEKRQNNVEKRDQTKP